jgi:hypothetical protein
MQSAHTCHGNRVLVLCYLFVFRSSDLTVQRAVNLDVGHCKLVAVECGSILPVFYVQVPYPGQPGFSAAVGVMTRYAA